MGIRQRGYSMEQDWTGQCLCGAKRYRAPKEATLWQGVCHCRSCTKGAGAGAVGWVGVRREAFAWTGEAPTAYHNPDRDTLRYFCPVCGSSLAYSSAKWPKEIHFTAATLDASSQFEPTFSCYSAEAEDWVNVLEDVPAYPGTTPDI